MNKHYALHYCCCWLAARPDKMEKKIRHTNRHLSTYETAKIDNIIVVSRFVCKKKSRQGETLT